MIKKLTLLTFAFLLAITIGLSQSVESFDYTIGDNLEGLDGPGTWDGGWVVLKGNAETSIEDGGITSADLALNSAGNKLVMNHPAGQSGSRMYRKLATPITDDGGTYYLSWFAENDYDNPGGNGSVNQMMFANSATYIASGPNGQLVRMGKIFGTENFGIDGPSSGGFATISGTDTRNGSWYVAVLIMSGDANAETLHIFVDPDPSQALDFANADITRNPTLNNGFDAIGNKTEGSETIVGTIDEIRFGGSFAEVISPNLVVAPAPAVENFNAYAPSDLLDGSGSATGGWGDAWKGESGGLLVNITADGLNNFNLLKGTSGNKATFDYSQAGTPNLRFERPLGANFPDDGSTYYLSFSTESMITNTNGTVAYFMLVDTDALGAGGPGGQLVQIGKPLNTNEIGVGVGSSPGQFSLTGASAEDAHLVVVKVKMSGNADPDTVDIFVDPSLTTEPTTPDGSWTFGTNLNNGFNGVGIKVEGTGTGIISSYEDIHVGFSYADVIPTDLVDIDPQVSALAFDKFSYPTGGELPGLGGTENGWEGPWLNVSDPDSSIVVAGGIYNNNLLVRTSGERVKQTSIGTGNFSDRLFATPIDDTNGEFWFSAHMAVTDVTGLANVGALVLLDTAAGNVERVVIGKQFGQTNIFATGGGQAGGATQTGEQYDLQSGRWFLGHMVYNTTNSNWEMDLWIDHNPANTPVEADANIQNKVYNATQFNGVRVKVAGDPGITLNMDDLLIGATFDDVVPNDLIPIPPLPSGATEKFNDYAAGSNLVGQNGGTGWTDGWELVGGADPVIDDEGLVNLAYVKQTSGTSLVYEMNGRAVRTLDGGYGDVGRTFWLSWMYQAEDGAGNVAHLVLADTAAYAATGGGGQLAQIGKLFGGSSLGIVSAQNSGAIPDVSTDDVHWLLAEIVTNGSGENDQIYLWVDADISTQPARDTANAVAGANLTNWNGLGFKVDGDPGVTVRFDDILLGNNWSEVIPSDLIDIDPPAMPQPAVERFEYTVGENLDMQNGGTGWGDVWTMTEGNIVVDENSISSDKVDPAGNKVDLNQSVDPITYDRPFFDIFGTENDDEIWMSFLLSVDQKSIGNEGSVSLTQNGTPVFSLGGVQGLDNVGMSYNGGAPINSTSQSVLGVNWYVVRINPDGGAGLDEIRVWVNPTEDAIPNDNDALFTVADADLNAGFDALRLSASGAGTMRMFVDEFYIGFEYREVSSKFGSDDPDLFAYEPFNYDSGQTLDELGGINAFWDGTWMASGNLASNETTILEESDAFPGFETIGNKVQYNYIEDGSQIRYDRELAFPMESDGSTYWLTWFQNTTTGDQLNNVSNMTLRNENAAANDGMRLSIGRMFANGKFGVVSPPANNKQETEVDDIGLNWVVVKIQTVDDPNIPDSVYLWINPDANVEPDTSTAQAFNGTTQKFYAMGFLKDGIDHIRFRTEGANGAETPHVVNFDEFRIATAWQSASVLTNTIEVVSNDAFQFSAFPNPFVDELTLKFDVPKSDDLQITLHDTQGRLLSTVAQGRFSEGEHTVNWSVGSHINGIANGIYYLRIANQDSVTVRKLILLRN